MIFIIFADGIAIVLPHLDLVIALTGALGLSILTFIYPAIFEVATFWKSTKNQNILLARTACLIFVGLAASVFGSYKSISDLIDK